MYRLFDMCLCNARLEAETIYAAPEEAAMHSHAPAVSPSRGAAAAAAVTASRPAAHSACSSAHSSSRPRKPSSTSQARPFSRGWRKSQALPTTRSPGGRLPSDSMASATWASVVRMMRWSGQLARSMTAHGVERGQRTRLASAARASGESGVVPSGWSASASAERWAGHEEDDGAGGDVLGGRWGLTLLAGAGADEDLVGDVALGDGDAGEEGRAEGARHAGQDADPVAEAPCLEPVHLLAAAAVDKGVALLEAQDGLALAHAAQRRLEELLLGALRVAGELAGDVDGRAPRDQVQHGRGDELVGEDEVGAVDGVEGGAREERGVAGPAAGEDEPADPGWRRRALVVARTTEELARRGGVGAEARVRGEEAVDVLVGDGGELPQGPVLADLAEPADAPVADVLLGDEPVEAGALVERVVEVAESEGRVVAATVVVGVLDAAADLAEAGAGGAEPLGQGGGDLAPDARGELAAAAVCGDADLERAVGVDGEEGKGAEVRRVDDVDGDAVAAAEARDVLAQGVARAAGDEDGVDDAADVVAAEAEEVGVLKGLLLPADGAVVDLGLQAVVQVRRRGGDEDGRRARGEGLGAARGGERVGADDEVDVAGADEAREHCVVIARRAGRVVAVIILAVAAAAGDGRC
ncbi:hypothetical protein O9K51_01615 [Purpureocillium lavendulum]|uniref:Uncharacterized protein n=1 Tax=Purpureocillium lavendulum TaxID=1247861 RepID=A0AB34G5R3_9HYPO|nr:hypothetical protein O9K51_01615 [Purpureocillium lavendulum]